MIELKLDLPERLEKHLVYLETISKRPKEFIMKEALIRYLEDAEDVAKYYEEDKKAGGKTYTTQDILEEINLK